MGLNFDMSGMVQPCNQNIGYYLQDEDKKHYNVLTDDLKEIWNSKHRKQLLDDHVNDIRNPACQQCWDCATMPVGVVTLTRVACGTRQIMH